MTVSDNQKKYDCTTCPYPRYKDGSIIFCDVCIRKILDEQKAKKERKKQPSDYDSKIIRKQIRVKKKECSVIMK